MTREQFEEIRDEVYADDERDVLATGLCRTGHEQAHEILRRVDLFFAGEETS